MSLTPTTEVDVRWDFRLYLVREEIGDSIRDK